ncbi:MAG: hypothetical protein IJO70_12140 [Lachnospiraceae bacterium]|nr:hypothetical protein [Lachnospiraceae bacterium]
MDNNNLKPKSIGGISFKEEAAKSSQPSYQNQSSQPQGGGKSSGADKSVIICWILGAIALVLLIVLIVAIVKKNSSSDDSKETTGTETTASEDDDGKTDETTEADTEGTTENTTEATTEQTTTASSYEYIAPTAFSGDWTDFQISINGDYYQFPFPYYVLSANGWGIDNAPSSVGSGETEVVSAASPHSGKDFTFYVTNPNATAQPIDSCLVTALLIESDCTEDEIKLADNLVFLTATKNDFKAEFGAPDFVQEYGDMEYVSYITDDYEGCLELEVDANKVCYKIYIENMAMPEGLEANVDIPTEAPEINASYVAPTGPSTDVADSIITIDGQNYKLPCPVSEFIKNGWKMETMTEDYIYGDSSTLSAFEKDGEKFFCTITNYTEDTIYTANGMVTMIDAYDDYAKAIEIVFPGNIALSGNASQFEAAYSGYENYVCERDDEYETLCYNVYIPLSGDNESIFIWIDCDYNTGEILEYQYEYSDY